mmetsp:Transcript_1338/g.1606  ORF Transcript_1338/g.1606 Transcript_1338/m.1606 type:complete len:161 (-) Transcript_1338:424-906(-)
MSLEEYQSQLSDIELLLAESPDDESLLTLKNDLVELIALTKEQEQASENDADTNANGGADETGAVRGTEDPAGVASLAQQEGGIPVKEVESNSDTATSSTSAVERETTASSAAISTNEISTTTATSSSTTATKSKTSIKKSKKNTFQTVRNTVPPHPTRF